MYPLELPATHVTSPSTVRRLIMLACILTAIVFTAMGFGHYTGFRPISPPSWLFVFHQRLCWNELLHWVLWRVSAALIFLAVVLGTACGPRAVVKTVLAAGKPGRPMTFVVLAMLYLIFWHAALGSHWCNDDFMNLSALQQRMHTWIDYFRAFSWVDAVDGNYRPVATYLWLGFMTDFAAILHVDPEFFSRLGQAAMLILFVAFFARLASSLGIGALAVGSTVLFWLSRSSLFTIHHWTSAMSDVFSCLGQVIAFTCWWRYRQKDSNPIRDAGASKPTLNRRSGYWAASLVIHFLALLAKQSAMIFPWMIACAELVLIPPAVSASKQPAISRLWRAILEALPYALLSLTALFLGQGVFQQGTPYPIVFDPYHLVMSGAYFAWAVSGFLPFYWNPFQLMICIFIGWSLVFLIWRGKRSAWAKSLTSLEARVVSFGLITAFPYWGLMTLIPKRFIPYYLAPALPWVCLSAGVMVRAWWRWQRGNPFRLGQLGIGLALIASIGFIESEGKRVDFLYSGGHPMGSGYQRFPRVSANLEPILLGATGTVVLIDFPVQQAWWAGLIRTYHPGVRRILSADSGASSEETPKRPPGEWTWFHNGLDGLYEVEAGLPSNSGSQHFHWELPFDPAKAVAIIRDPKESVRAVRFINETRLESAINYLVK